MSSYASGLAFNAFLAIFPLLLGGLIIVSLIAPSATGDVRSTIVSAFPSDAQGQIAGVLNDLHRGAGALAVVSGLGILWAGTNIFAAMEFALAQIFGGPLRNILRQRAMALTMLLVFLLAISAVGIGNALVGVLPNLPWAGFAIGATAMIGLLVAIYRLVPNRTYGIGHVWQGAVVAGLLIEVLTLVFPIYAHLSHGFNTYGQAFALFFLLAAWLGLLCNFILIGAVWVRVTSGEPTRHGLLAAPLDAAREVHKPEEMVHRVLSGPGSYNP